MQTLKIANKLHTQKKNNLTNKQMKLLSLVPPKVYEVLPQ